MSCSVSALWCFCCNIKQLQKSDCVLVPTWTIIHHLSIQRSSCLPDENNMAALQEEVKQMKLRELETLRSFREMQDTVAELNQRWQVAHNPSVCVHGHPSLCCVAVSSLPSVFRQHHMSRGSSTGGGGGHWKESPKKNAMNELQDKLMTVRLREAQGQAELREVKLKALQLESQVRLWFSTVAYTYAGGNDDLYCVYPLTFSSSAPESDPQQTDRPPRAGTLRAPGPAPDADQSEQGSPGPTQWDEKEAGRVRLQGLNGE